MHKWQDVSSEVAETALLGRTSDKSEILVLAEATPLRWGIEQLLRLAGWDVVATPNPEAAYLLVEGHPPAVIVIDRRLMAEDLRWLALCRGRHACIPVVLIANHGAVQFPHLDPKNVTILTKPFTVTEFLSAVGDAITRRTFSPGLNPAGRPTYYGPAG